MILCLINEGGSAMTGCRYSDYTPLKIQENRVLLKELY